MQLETWEPVRQGRTLARSMRKTVRCLGSPAISQFSPSFLLVQPAELKRDLLLFLILMVVGALSARSQFVIIQHRNLSTSLLFG